MILGFDLSRLNVHSPYTVWQDGDVLLSRLAILKDENVDNYIAMIVEKANPHCAEVIASFEEQVKLFRENK